MTLAEVKLNIIRRISEMEDTRLLAQIQSWLEFESDDSIYHLSDEEIQRIEEGKEEYKLGKTISEEEANSEVLAGYTMRLFR